MTLVVGGATCPKLLHKPGVLTSAAFLWLQPSGRGQIIVHFDSAKKKAAAERRRERTEELLQGKHLAYQGASAALSLILLQPVARSPRMCNFCPSRRRNNERHEFAASAHTQRPSATAVFLPRVRIRTEDKWKEPVWMCLTDAAHSCDLMNRASVSVSLGFYFLNMKEGQR